MNPSKHRSIIGLVVVGALAWLMSTAAAVAQVEQAHLRIDGMT